MLIGLLTIVVGIALPLVIKAVTYESDDWYAGSSVTYNLVLLDEDGSVQKNVEIIKIVHKSDGEPAFCVEPYKGTSLSNFYTSIKQDTIFESLEQRIEVAKLVMAYKAVEEDYATNWDTSPTYAAAQYLIWETLGYSFDIESAESDYAEFASEISKIEKAKAIFEEETLTPDLYVDDTVYNVGDSVYVKDNNGILNATDYTVTASAGISDLQIVDGGISFVITSDEPATKIIEVEYIGDVPARWDYGELWSDGLGQKFFSFFSVDLPTLYSGASISLFLETPGTLTIIKVDEDDEVIEDGEFTFALYEAIYEDGEYCIGDILEGYEAIVVSGSKSIEVAAGHYFIKEVNAEEGYIIDEEAYLIEVISDSEGEFTLVNTQKNLTIAVSKYDEDDGSPISGAEFTVYSFEDGEDSIYLLRTSKAYDLTELLESESIYIAEEDISFDGQYFISEEKIHIIAYTLSDEVISDFTLVGFNPLVYRSSFYVDPLENVKVYKDSTNITTGIECIYDGTERVVYKLTDGSDQYLIIRAKQTYDIGEAPEVSSETTIYKINNSYDIYTGTSSIYTGSGYGVIGVASTTTSSSGKATFSNLKVTSEYLVCEVTLPSDYEYGSQDPCTIVSEETASVTNVSFTDKIRTADIEIYKTDSNRDILLNGAEFMAYKAKKTDEIDLVFAEEAIEDATYMGYFISGYLHVTLADFGLADTATGYTLKIYNGEELIKEVAMEAEVNVDGLSDGVYNLYLCDEEGNLLSTTVQKEVARGKIIFEDIRYDEVLILYEVKAPSGYKTDTDGFVISVDEGVINGRVSYNRVNEAVILPAISDHIIVETSCHGS